MSFSDSAVRDSVLVTYTYKDGSSETYYFDGARMETDKDGHSRYFNRPEVRP
jgi:hypothetical protein